MLVIHGVNDTVVLPNQSEDFYKEAISKGKSVGGLIVWDDKHGIDFYSHAVIPLQFFNDIITAKKTGIPYTPYPDTLLYKHKTDLPKELKNF